MRNNGFLGVGANNIAHSTTNDPQTTKPRQLRAGEPVSQFERLQAIRYGVHGEIRKLGARPSVVYKLYDPIPFEKLTANKDLPFIQSPGIRFSEGGDLLDANAAGGGFPAWGAKPVGGGVPYNRSRFQRQLAFVHGQKGPFS